MTPTIDLIETISAAGHPERPNEDRVGCNTRLAWVIDGATDLGPAGLMGKQTGAAWLAEEAGGSFAEADPSCELQTIVRHVYDQVQAAYDRQRTRLPIGDWERPSAAFLAARSFEGRVDIAWAADCVALLMRPGGVQRLGPVVEPDEANAARAALQRDQGYLGRDRDQDLTTTLRLRRAAADRAALTVVTADAGKVAYASHSCRVGDELVLMTDGLSALIDDYGMNIDEFVRLMKSEGLTGLLARLRAIETDDEDGHAFPRMKRSDDASGVWVRLNA